MRTTVRIDDDLLRELKLRAEREEVSLTKLLNRLLRLGVETLRLGETTPKRYREPPIAMGLPKVDLTKALALTGQLEDDETVEKIRRRK